MDIFISSFDAMYRYSVALHEIVIALRVNIKGTSSNIENEENNVS